MMDDGQPKLAGAAQQLRHLGFLLVGADPSHVGGSELLVALRDRPTLAHFDPEQILYWRTGEDRRGHRADLTRETHVPLRAGFSWGPVAIVDRFRIANEFVTLGGELTAGAVAPDTTVTILRSPGPILRLGGHSQDVDRVALELGAFFARMMVPIDFEPGVEEAISAATPIVRYAAFVAFEQERYAAHAPLRDEQPGTAAVLAAEARRIANAEPETWGAGKELLSRMGLGPPV